MHKSKNTFKEHEKGEDYHFLISPLPHVRDVPKRRKLAVRTRLQQVLMKEVMTAAISSPTSRRSYDHYQSHPTTPSPNATRVQAQHHIH